MESAFWQAVNDRVEESGTFASGNGWWLAHPATEPRLKTRETKKTSTRMVNFQYFYDLVKKQTKTRRYIGGSLLFHWAAYWGVSSLNQISSPAMNV